MHTTYIYDEKRKMWIEYTQYMIEQLMEQFKETRDIRDKATIALLKGLALNLLYIRRELEWIINALQSIAKKDGVTLSPPPSEQNNTNTQSSG